MIEIDATGEPPGEQLVHWKHLSPLLAQFTKPEPPASVQFLATHLTHTCAEAEPATARSAATRLTMSTDLRVIRTPPCLVIYIFYGWELRNARFSSRRSMIRRLMARTECDFAEGEGRPGARPRGHAFTRMCRNATGEFGYDCRPM